MRTISRGIGVIALALAFDACATGCSVSAVSLVFGGYDPFRLAHADTSGSVSVTCIARRGQSMSYSITLDQGSSGSFFTRRMQSPMGTSLHYNLYVTSSRSVIWGDGNSGTSVLTDSFTMPSTQVTRQYPVYGRVFARQNARVGNYSDSIVVTLSF